jgi:hypothetical protein
LRAFENSEMNGIFGPQREERIGGWRKLHNEKLYVLYFLSNIVRVIKLRMMKWARCIAHVSNMKNAYKYSVRKSEEKRLLPRPRYRWDYNIKMDHRGIWCFDVNWIH